MLEHTTVCRPRALMCFFRERRARAVVCCWVSVQRQHRAHLLFKTVSIFLSHFFSTTSIALPRPGLYVKFKTPKLSRQRTERLYFWVAQLRDRSRPINYVQRCLNYDLHCNFFIRTERLFVSDNGIIHEFVTARFAPLVFKSEYSSSFVLFNLPQIKIWSI